MAVKALVTGSLVGQHPLITDGQLPIFIPLHPKLDQLPFLGLEGDVVGVGMVMVTIAVMVVGLSSHIHDGGRDRQHRGVLIFDKLRDPLADDNEEQDKPDQYE